MARGASVQPRGPSISWWSGHCESFVTSTLANPSGGQASPPGGRPLVHLDTEDSWEGSAPGTSAGIAPSEAHPQPLRRGLEGLGPGPSGVCWPLGGWGRFGGWSWSGAGCPCPYSGICGNSVSPLSGLGFLWAQLSVSPFHVLVCFRLKPFRFSDLEHLFRSGSPDG